jgi:ABC-2 type transport system ATP-binding protein
VAGPGGTGPARSSDAPAVRTRRLTKDYGSTRAVDRLDLEVHAGEIMGFLGPNGAGKSTTIRILLDLIRPTSGSAQVKGFDCQSEGRAARAASGYLPGDLRLYERWTGAEVVRFVTELRGPGRPDGAAEVAEQLELDLGRRVNAYSRGNRQKLGLVLALAHHPDVLILDEPTSGLDPMHQRTIWAVLRERAAAGAAVLLSSHVMSEVESVCDSVAILRHGRLLEFGPVRDLVAGAPARLEITFDGPAPDLSRVPGVLDLTANGSGAASLSFRGDPNDLIRELAGARIATMTVRPPRLDDVVLALYRQEQA